MGSLVSASVVHSRDIRLIMISSFFYMASTMMITPLIVGFSQTLETSGAIISITGSLMNFVSLFCRPVVGNITDRISKYRLTVIGASLILVSSIGYSLAFDIVIVIISRIINGIGFACCSISMSTWLAELLPRDKIGSGMGIYGTINALSMAVAPAVGVAVSQKIGYRAVFVLASIFAFLCMVCSSFVSDRLFPRILDKKNIQKKTMSPLLNKKVIPVALIVMLFGIPYTATQSFLASYVQAQDFSVTIGIFFPVYAVFLLILRLMLKNKFDRWPYSFFFIICTISAFWGMLCMTTLTNNFMVLLAAAGFAGGYGIICSVSQSTAILLAGPGHRGVANSTYYIGLDLSMALGFFIGGLLYSNVKITMFYPYLMICLPLGILIFAIWKIISKCSKTVY